MTPAEEDALVEQFASMTYALATRPPKESVTHAIRLAIRAAVAQERERCAKVCEGWYPGIDEDGEPVKVKLTRTQDECAAAIRRG